MAPFQTQGNEFIHNGNQVRLISGAIHYFRVVPEYWKDRLLKLKACGFNTVETYIPWNLHEPQPGNFNFAGLADVVQFIQTAGELGLFVIARPSPYICAEWEFGGLPAWLLADPDIKLRSYNEPYLKHVDAYYDVLLPKLKPLLCTNGGPIIAMQIENEYGSYGNDTRYLEHIKQSMVERGMDVLLFTSDGPEHFMLQGGMVPGVLATVNFGSRARESFEMLKQYQPEGPLMCMEYWNGWFDHWGEEHHTRDVDDTTQVFEEMLREGASVNFYMFHGGTNFGFYNGANCPSPDHYEPTITSYDYDVLLDESGDMTDKYNKVKKVLAKYTEIEEIVLPEPVKKQAYGKVRLNGHSELFSNLDTLTSPVTSNSPVTMEKLGQNYGFILYSTHISGPRNKSKLNIQDVHDRALIYVDGKYLGVIERWNKDTIVEFEVPVEGCELSILVENMGRINYGPYMNDPKGITEGVRFGPQFLYGWTIHTLPLDQVSTLSFAEGSYQHPTPVFYKGTLEVEELGDTFLYLEGWTKGVVYVNGFNLGRYWNKGPQQSLYVPAPLLHEGDNEIVIFELHGCIEQVIEFKDKPNLG